MSKEGPSAEDVLPQIAFQNKKRSVAWATGGAVIMIQTVAWPELSLLRLSIEYGAPDQTHRPTCALDRQQSSTRACG